MRTSDYRPRTFDPENRQAVQEGAYGLKAKSYRGNQLEIRSLKGVSLTAYNEDIFEVRIGEEVSWVRRSEITDLLRYC